MSAKWDRARTLADAVLYEGYLLYPYRATSSKNQSRWQFGVLGPEGAAETGIGEDSSLASQFPIDGSCGERGELSLVVRFLHLQHRHAERDIGNGQFERTDEFTSGTQTWVTWDEAVERELSFGPLTLAELSSKRSFPVDVPAGTDVENVDGGRLIRTRAAITGVLDVIAEQCDGLFRVSLTVRNTAPAASGKNDAIAASMIGTHVIAQVTGCEFVSLLEPPDAAAAAVDQCTQHRCFPVLAGKPGERDLILVSPIILYDHPEIAEQSEGALYDSTEIDEILTLRVMTMTDEEKAQAKATDPLAAKIIERCDSMSPESLQQLHGVLRNPHANTPAGLVPEIPEGVDWWDPLADNAVRPGVDAVLVNGVRVSAGSRVRLHPGRRADAQDMFFAGKAARVTSVHEDVDGQRHVGVIVEDDPAAEMPEHYGRYLYFAPDEIEPLGLEDVSPTTTTERRSPTWT